ncbi:MAG: SidA/IucD/PvdA family monooxygenase [Bdellovibrionales bacterium]
MATDSLTVVGAGPKALAIAAKAYVLRELGFSVPQIKILEKTGIAANWKPGTGFTNGRLRLGTSPEKDVGFPYCSSCWGDDFNARIDRGMAQFSWRNYLVEKRRYASWIDRGRPQPEHRIWAEYLEWVFSQLRGASDLVEYIEADCDQIELTGDRSWLVSGKRSNGSRVEFEANGLVLTGPGEIKNPKGIPNDPRVLDVRSFWSRLPELAQAGRETYVAVIGNGETAASTAVVIGRLEAPLRIDVIAPVAMSYSRGESYVENHMYTDPFKGNWHELTYSDRRNFIERTDRGVFSIAAKKELDQMDHIDIIPGWFRRVQVNSANQLVVELEYGKNTEHRVYDYVVLSIGFDPLQFLTACTTQSMKVKILERARLPSWSVADFEESIAEDLALENLNPKLHVPMLAALKQGPGFPNLSCLGRLSDQILLSYVSLDQEVQRL